MMGRFKNAAKATGHFALNAVYYSTVAVFCPIWCPIALTWSTLDARRRRYNNPDDPKTQKRRLRKQKKNRKVRARPLLLGHNAISLAEEACSRPGTSSQSQSRLFSKLPPEVRSQVWEIVFADLDVHVFHVTSTRSTGLEKTTIPTIYHPDSHDAQCYAVVPCIDHAHVAHTPISAQQEKSELARVITPKLCDLACWPHDKKQLSAIWSKDSQRKTNMLANILAVSRTSRIVQAETLRALANTASVCATRFKRNLNRGYIEALPFRSQRVLARLPSLVQAAGATIPINPCVSLMYPVQWALDHGKVSLKLFLTNFRDVPDGEQERKCREFEEAFPVALDLLRRQVPRLEIVVLDVDEDYVARLPQAKGVVVTALPRMQIGKKQR